MEKHMGPYRATKLWNDVIRTFRQGMPVSRHRRYMKSYEDSFSAAEAIDWLHAQLQVNPNFGPAVTRAQTLQLLEKFQKARVFDDVRGGKRQETIADNGRLYRFSHVSPAKSRTPARSSRTPLATRASVNTERTSVVPPTKLDFGKEAPSDVKPLSNCHLMTSSRLTVEEIEEIWKNMTLDSLQKALQLHSLDEILDSDFVNAQQIIHNMTHVNKNGVVCNIEKEDQLPYWVLSAMRCLAHWPNKVEDNLPDYPGFERDVFKVVKDYFEGLAEPLLTFSMYEVFTNVFGVLSPLSKNRVIDALRICCLLLPPPNRRKLHLLLRLMVKMSENVELNVDDSTGTRKLVHQTFTRCILRSAEEADFDEMLSLRLVAFMMDNYSEIMKVPEDQKLQIEERIAYLRRSKIHLVWDEPPTNLTYCAQVSVEEFERQRMTTSQQALNRLLEDIVNDKTMTDKDRKRRLKQFQKAHPDVYAARFPPSESAPVNNVRKPRIKPALLSRPLLKLKSFRI